MYYILCFSVRFYICSCFFQLGFVPFYYKYIMGFFINAIKHPMMKVAHENDSLNFFFRFTNKNENKNKISSILWIEIKFCTNTHIKRRIIFTCILMFFERWNWINLNVYINVQYHAHQGFEAADYSGPYKYAVPPKIFNESFLGWQRTINLRCALWEKWLVRAYIYVLEIFRIHRPFWAMAYKKS